MSAVDDLRNKVELASGKIYVPPHIKVKGGKTVKVDGYWRSRAPGEKGGTASLPAGAKRAQPTGKKASQRDSSSPKVKDAKSLQARMEAAEAAKEGGADRVFDDAAKADAKKPTSVSDGFDGARSKGVATVTEDNGTTKFAPAPTEGQKKGVVNGKMSTAQKAERGLAGVQARQLDATDVQPGDYVNQDLSNKDAYKRVEAIKTYKPDQGGGRVLFLEDGTRMKDLQSGDKVRTKRPDPKQLSPATASGAPSAKVQAVLDDMDVTEGGPAEYFIDVDGKTYGSSGKQETQELIDRLREAGANPTGDDVEAFDAESGDDEGDEYDMGSPAARAYALAESDKLDDLRKALDKMSVEDEGYDPEHDDLQDKLNSLASMESDDTVTADKVDDLVSSILSDASTLDIPGWDEGGPSPGDDDDDRGVGDPLMNPATYQGIADSGAKLNPSEAGQQTLRSIEQDKDEVLDISFDGDEGQYEEWKDAAQASVEDELANIRSIIADRPDDPDELESWFDDLASASAHALDQWQDPGFGGDFTEYVPPAVLAFVEKLADQSNLMNIDPEDVKGIKLSVAGGLERQVHGKKEKHGSALLRLSRLIGRD